MSAVIKLKMEVLNYFASLKSPEFQTLSVRDFNSQLMSKTFDPTDRAALGTALEELVTEGLLVQRSPTSYSLTPQGNVAAVAAKTELQLAIASRGR